MIKRLFLWMVFTAALQNMVAQNRGLSKRTDTSSIDMTRRIALVVGNANYQNNTLTNPVQDATDMANLLKTYGFEVVLKTNLDRKALNSAINAFGDSMATKRGVSCFYYSGHGLQFNAQNYILPLSSQLKTASDIEDETVAMDKILRKMNDARSGLNLVFLDACRNNPFYQTLTIPKGLSDQNEMPKNTLVFYATSPNHFASDGKGKNSPFTGSLVEAITGDSIEFFQVVKKVVRDVKKKTNDEQVPWIVGSPQEDFYFKARTNPKMPNLYILSIGISRYRKIQNLMYAAKDAEDVAHAFMRQGGQFYGQVKPYILTDDAATKPNILAAIRHMKDSLRSGDVIMIFFSGHCVDSRETKTSYFLPAEGDLDRLRETAVDYENIRSLLSDFPCKSILFIDGSIVSSQIQDLTKTENGVVVLSSHGVMEQSIESSELKNGAFASFLIRGIHGAADEEGTGFVDLLHLSIYLKQNVRKFARTMHFNQDPELYMPLGMSNFRISKSFPATSFP